MHCEGPDWIPATVIKVIGPVTYLAETDLSSGHRRLKVDVAHLKVGIVAKISHASRTIIPTTPSY